MRHFSIKRPATLQASPVSLRAAFFAGQPLKGVRVAEAQGISALAQSGNSGLRRIDLPKDEGALQRFIRDWTKRHQKRLAAGLPATMLVLAMGSAAAQAQDSMVDLAGLSDVASVEVLADGTARVTLTNGAILIVPEGSFLVAADGAVMVSAATADSIMAAMAGADATGGGEYALAGAGLALAAGAAAGGGSGGGSPVSGGGATGGGAAPGTGGGIVPEVVPAPLAPTTAGRVVDGYVANATVFRDLNANNIRDEGEPFVTTDGAGLFSGLEGSGGVLIATGGIDISTGQPFTGQLTAPSDATVITPLTTLAQALIDQSGGALSAADAGAQVAEAFGLTEFDVNTTDPVGTDNLAALKAGAQVAAIISIAAAAAGTEGEAAASNAVAKSLAQAITNAEGGAVILDTSTITEALEEALGENEAIGAQASALQTVINEIGVAEDVARVETVQTVAQGQLVKAVADGGDLPSTEEINTAIADSVPLRPTLDPVNLTVINAADAEGFALEISGTGRDGSSITVQFGDLTIDTGVEVAGGTWSYTVREVPQDGAVTLSVTATEMVDETPVTSGPSVVQAAITVDTTPPAAPVVSLAEDTGTADNVTQNGQINVTGLEAGATAEYALNGSAEWTAFEGDSFELTRDAEYSIVVRQTDAAGNTSAASEPVVFTLDTQAPMEPTINAISDDDVVPAAEMTFTVSGAAEAGAEVRVTIGGITQSATAPQEGPYEVVVVTPKVAGIYDISVVAVDAAGNTSAPATRAITVEAPPMESATDLIGSAMTLAQMEAALSAFANEQNGLNIPDGLLTDLAGDALIYRGGLYELTFSASVFANEEGADIPNGTVLSGTFRFELPLGEFLDQVGNAPNPEAVFQYQQDNVIASTFEGFDAPGLRTTAPSLRMDVETFELGEDADFIRELVGQEGLDALVEAGSITSLQIWLSNVETAQQNSETGEFFGLIGEEVSINFFRPGEVGLEAFFDDIEGNIFRQVQIERFIGGNDDTLATAKIDSLDVNFIPGDGYIAEDLVAGFNALIDLRLAVNEAVESANSGELTVADLQAIGNALVNGDIPFAPPLLAGEAISKAAVDRLGAFLSLPGEEQTQIVDAFNAGNAQIAKFTDLLDAPGLFAGMTGGGDVATPSNVEFIPDGEGGNESSLIRLNGENVDLEAIVRGVLGDQTAPLTFEIISSLQTPGLPLNNGNVAIKLSVAGIPGSPVNEDWLLIVEPDGEVHATVRGGLGNEAMLLDFTQVVGDESGIVFSVINAALGGGQIVQTGGTYFSTYILSPGDLTSIPAGNLTVSQLVAEAESLITVNSASNLGPLEEGQVVLPSTVGIFPEGGNVTPYFLIGIGDLVTTPESVSFDIARSVFVDREGLFTSLPGAVKDVNEQELGENSFGYVFSLEVVRDFGGEEVNQTSLLLYNPVDDEIVYVRTIGGSDAEALVGLGSNDIIIPLGAPNNGGPGDLVFLPTDPNDVGKETIVIRPADAFEGARISVTGFNPVEDEIALFGTDLGQQFFAVTVEEVDSFESFVPPQVADGQLQLFAVSEIGGASTVLLAVDGNEVEAELATFNGVTSAQFNGYTVSLFNPGDLLETLSA